MKNRKYYSIWNNSYVGLVWGLCSYLQIYSILVYILVYKPYSSLFTKIYLHVWNESTVMKMVCNLNSKNAILFVILICLIGQDGDEFLLPSFFPLQFTYSIWFLSIWLYTQCLLSASQHHVWVFPLLPERQQKLRTQIVYNGLPSFWEDYYMLIYTHCWELMNSVGSHGSSSLPFVMKVMVCHFVSDSHEVMTALIVVLPLIVVVEISLQLHRWLYTQCACVGVNWELVQMG
jgi:hypothetical protein